MDKYKAVILQVLASKGLTGANAEDAFQDVMRKMLVGYKRFTRDGRGGFRAWLRCIAFSAAMNWYKRNPKRPNYGTRFLAGASFKDKRSKGAGWEPWRGEVRRLCCGV